MNCDMRMECHTDTLDLCKICLGQIDPYKNPALLCVDTCGQKVHIRCLKRGTLPSNLIGDVFYDLHCSMCSEDNNELLIRQRLSWLTAVILALYNLKEKSNGISRRGYFHWKSDISTFINNNWDTLFTKAVKRKKNWIGTISGTLSHYNGIFFKSGTIELGDQGWWKLVVNDPPEVLIDQYNKSLELKKQNQAKLKGKHTDINNEQLEINMCNGDNSNANDSFVNVNYSTEVKNTISNNIEVCDDFTDILGLDIDMPNIADDITAFNHTENVVTEELNFQNCNILPDVFINDCFQYITDNVNQEPFEEINVSDIPVLDNCQEDIGILIPKCDIEDHVQQKENEPDKYNDLPQPLQSLFTQSTSRPWPWDESFKLNPDDVRPLMSEREEEFVLQKIEQFKHLLGTAPVSIRRLYRKLAVRKLKRQYGLPILNVDTYGQKCDQKSFQMRKKGNAVLDRFISEDTSIFFEQRLQGHCEPTSVHSPYTNRLLKPFIRRDTSSKPLWLKVTRELLSKVNKKKVDWKLQPHAPIDYSYIRPQHIPAINSLCTQFFWPGVDLTECLQYPDFTCVVLYKKLVIGFAIMVPDVGYNEAYISFLLVRPEWRKAGIGKFMLYHLIQTCMGKDITLHVSATNPALLLYQKFGFKQEEFIQDFYDKYILPSSKESKHALFLRLSR